MRRGKCLWLALACVLLMAGQAMANPIAEVARPQIANQLAFLLLVTLLEAGVLYLLLRPRWVVAETFVANVISYLAGFIAFLIWALFINPLPESSIPFFNVVQFRSHFVSLAVAEGQGVFLFLFLCFCVSVLTEGAYFWWRWPAHRGRRLVLGVLAANALTYALFFPILKIADGF